MSQLDGLWPSAPSVRPSHARTHRARCRAIPTLKRIMTCTAVAPGFVLLLAYGSYPLYGQPLVRKFKLPRFRGRGLGSGMFVGAAEFAHQHLGYPDCYRSH